jgi:drug/metabolite transporter (DMT)-like permease
MQAVWIFLGLVAALSAALRDVASKHAVRRASPLAVALGVAAVPALLLGAIVLVTGALTGQPIRPDHGFWTALLVSGGINAIATPLIVLALQRSDLSLVAPLTSLTPLFMLATGVVVLGEWPGPRGVAGVAIIVAGAWLLALPAADDARTTTAGPAASRTPATADLAASRIAPVRDPGLPRGRPPVLTSALAPVRALARDAGARAMLVVAFLYSISSTYDKVGTQASSPLTWAAAVNLVVALVLAAILAARLLGVRGRPEPGAGPGIGARATGPAGAPTGEATRAREGQPAARPAAARPDHDAARPAAGPRPVLPIILLAGLLAAVMAAAQMTALLLTLAAYVIAVKRTSTLFAVLLGRSVFHEPRTRQRLAGAAIMLAGFLLVVLEG